ncbi:DUF2459 domain-containing protein [Desulfovibrio cuneatus]|uniref:DUF2459 domain-containing protein n=1 Tax=Desulfovibrio cuneatus TaxID=159728 RepID=UPI00040F1755|nr:DUF2459 domain-containing protein [Desulfovibrio cuneatus]
MGDYSRFSLSSRPPQNRGLYKALAKWLAYAVVIGGVAVVLLGLLPSPLHHLMAGESTKALWALREADPRLKDTAAHIPVYVVQTGSRLDFALPAYAVVTAPEGRFAIDWGKYFGYEFILPKPSRLPVAWSFPDFPFDAGNTATTASPLAPVPSSPASPPTPPLEANRQALVSNSLWCLVGWGQPELYGTQGIWHTMPALAMLTSLVGSTAALHVDIWEGPMAPSQNIRRLYLTEAEYITLCRYIQQSVAKDGAGAPVPMLIKGYADVDSFFKGKERFAPWHNGVNWVVEGLHTINAPTSVWTPVAGLAMHHLP